MSRRNFSTFPAFLKKPLFLSGLHPLWNTNTYWRVGLNEQFYRIVVHYYVAFQTYLDRVFFKGTSDLTVVWVE